MLGSFGGKVSLLTVFGNGKSPSSWAKVDQSRKLIVDFLTGCRIADQDDD
jgi:hypothetical protein